MKTDEKNSLQVKKSFTASAERVFDAWIDPERAMKFLFATPSGEITRCDIDAKPGARFTITRHDEEGDTEHVGEYLVVDRPRKLVFTFGVPRYDPEMTRVTTDIVPTSTGCDLTLTHEGVRPEWKDQTVKGWTKILDGLVGALGD